MTRPLPTEANRESGFTLIEALVALVLIAVILAAIGELVATNSHGERSLERHVGLMETARLIAAGLPRDGEPLPKDLAGVMSGYRWQMRVSPFFERAAPVPGSRFIPVRIELRVRSPSGTMVALETVRLQSAGGH